jgi:hypothetical protein
MRGLDPRIHLLEKDVDARHKAGHDDKKKITPAACCRSSS